MWISWFTIKNRFLFVLFTQGKFCQKIICLFKLLFCKGFPQSQMKTFLFSCRSWQLVMYFLSSIHGGAKSEESHFFSCSILSPFPVIYSKIWIIPINSHQETYFLACKILKFQCAIISHWNKKKYTFFLSQLEINVHLHMNMNEQTRQLIWDVWEKDIQPLILPLPSCSPASQEKSPGISSRENCPSIFM